MVNQNPFHHFVFIIYPGQRLRTVWNESLKGTGYNLVHLFLHSGTNRLFSSTAGNIRCFDAYSGKTCTNMLFHYHNKTN